MLINGRMARYIVLYSYNGMLFIIKMNKLELKYQQECLAKIILNKNELPNINNLISFL